ncbi:MAG TPA: 50S ribosomal protein L17 [Candidatus Paceibacterota bacterium]|jgi:large subunit ribosomal protein L17|nr:50S ribosomal protein L17 [Candidatus Paceibacterota bacterium]
MRHHVKTRTLHRTRRQRTALLRSLARSLVLHEGITTTVAKAKELRPYIERLITMSKANTMVSRREVSSRLGGASDAVKKLHETIAPRYSARKGGYTRITRLGRIGKRVGESARIEFVK